MSEADYATKVSEAIERIQGQEVRQGVPRVAYVGNCALDERALMTLKERYHLTIVGCVMGQEDKKLFNAMKHKGADFIVSNPKQLVRVLTERPKPRHDELIVY